MAIPKIGGYIIAAVSAVALVAGTGCNNFTTLEKPYQPVTINDLVNDPQLEDRFVSVEGLAGNCGDLKISSDKNSQFCTISDGTNILYLKRTNSHSLSSDYKAAQEAFDAEANEGDNVQVFGRYQGDNLFKTEYFLINGVLYSVKR